MSEQLNVVKIALPLRKADAGVGLPKLKVKSAMKHNNDIFCLVFVPLCPKSIPFAKTTVVSQNACAILLAKNYVLYVRLNTLICL